MECPSSSKSSPADKSCSSKLDLRTVSSRSSWDSKKLGLMVVTSGEFLSNRWSTAHGRSSSLRAIRRATSALFAACQA